MNTREKILNAVLENQPNFTPLPEVITFTHEGGNVSDKFADTLISIGGRAVVVSDLGSVAARLGDYFDVSKRIATNIPELSGGAGLSGVPVHPDRQRRSSSYPWTRTRIASRTSS